MKTKLRWREQKGRTVCLEQVPYDVDGEALKAQFDVQAVRLVHDSATRQKSSQRKHAGLAYLVCRDAERAAKLVGTHQVGGRTVIASLLSDHDDQGRLKKDLKDKARESGLRLDAKVLKELGKTSQSVADRVIKDTAKAKTKNPSAFASGVLKRTRDEEGQPRPNKTKIKRLLDEPQVDKLVAAALKRSHGRIAKADLDSRVKDYLREFPKDQAAQALSLLADNRAKALKSPSAFLMGILRDMSSRPAKRRRS